MLETASYSDDLHKFSSTQDIIRFSNFGNLSRKEKDHLKDQGVDGRMGSK
jgi:hypothetical protein